MEPWHIKFVLSNDNNSMDYSINAGKEKVFSFRNPARFKEDCKCWSLNNIGGVSRFSSNIDAGELSSVFEASQPKQPIEIESENCHFIPFEALQVGGQFLGERNPVSRKAIGDIFAGGKFKFHSILILKVLADERHQYYEDQLISTLTQFPDITFESRTALSLEDLISLLTEKQRSIIHIIGHIVEDSFTDGASFIKLSDLKSGLTNSSIYSNLIFLSCCGKLAFERPDREKLFSTFFRQTHVNAVVGMTRIIYANCNQSYLDEFYRCVLSGKTVSESVRLTVIKNKSLPAPKEEDPLPIAHFGPSNCSFAIPVTQRSKIKKIAFPAIGLAIIAVILAIILLQSKPKFIDLHITDLHLSGRIENLPTPSQSMRHVLVAAASLSTGEVVWPQKRYAEIENNSFSYELFESDEERSLATTCFLLIVDISETDESFIENSTMNEYTEWVNANKVFGVERKLNQ